MSTIQYAAVRCFCQPGGTFKAVATVERTSPDGKKIERTEFSSSRASSAEAIAEALQMAGLTED